jgi:hypothetical protein
MTENGKFFSKISENITFFACLHSKVAVSAFMTPIFFSSNYLIVSKKHRILCRFQICEMDFKICSKTSFGQIVNEFEFICFIKFLFDVSA